MAIVSSQIVEDRPQADGRRWIRERHRDDLGEDHEFLWIAAAGEDAAARLSDRAAWLPGWLQTADLQRLLSLIATGDGPIVFRYATPAEVGPRLREEYKTASGIVVACISKWLLTRTDAELKAWFGGLTSTQVNQLKNRMTTRANALSTLNALVGE